MSSYLDALNDLDAGETISAGGSSGGSSNYTTSGDSSSSSGGSSSSSSSSSGGSSGAGGFSVPEEFRTDENYGETSTGSNGGSESPPDNGGYTNPTRPDRTEGGQSTNITGGSDSSDPVSGGGELDPAAEADEPVFSPADPIVGIGEQIEDATGGNVSVNDFLNSVLKSGGEFTTGVGGTTEGEDLTDFNIPDELTQIPEVIPPIMPENFPTANEPVSSDGPQWLTYGVAAVAAVAGLFFLSRGDS